MNNIEKHLKKCLKKRIRFNLSLVVSFLITGGISFANIIVESNSSGITINDSKIHENNVNIISKEVGENFIGISIYNNSTITNGESSIVDLNGSNSVGIFLSGAHGINKGTIKTNGTGGMGVLALKNSTFINEGNIEILGDSTSGNSITSGIDAQGGAAIKNSGSIKTTGWASFGVRNNGIAINEVGGEIITSGENANGMYSRKDNETDESQIINKGIIITNGNFSSGIRSNNSVITNIKEGNILTTGIKSNGADLLSSTFLNSGNIITSGEKSKGILLKNSIATNDTYGIIETSGKKAYGIHAMNGSVAINQGNILTDGENSHGMKIANLVTLYNNLTTPPDLSKIYTYEEFNEKISEGENNGNIYTKGLFSYGITADNGVSIVNNGEVNTIGKGSTGANLTFGSFGKNNKNITTTGEKAKGINLISTKYQIDEIEYKENEIYKYSNYIFETNKGTRFTNSKEGIIETKGDNSYGIYLESYFSNKDTIDLANHLEVNLIDGEVPKSSITNEGTIKTQGENTYGIFSINSIVNNNGLIHTKGKGAYGIYAIDGSVVNHKGKIQVNDPNAYGIVYDSTSKINISKTAEILVNGSGANAIQMIKNSEKTSNNQESILNNYGNIQVIGENAKGISISSQGTGINSGNIDINGNNIIAMYANGFGSSIKNLGTISLNLNDNSIAIKGENGANVSNSGTIKLKDYSEKTLNQSKIDQILNIDDNSIFVNTGVIMNSQDKIASASGEEVGDIVENIDKDQVYKSDTTVTIIGNKLEGVLNQSENFIDDGKYLLKVLNRENPLLISGTINAGKNAVEIGTNGKVDFYGNINSLENAFSLNDGELSSTNGNIVGDILLKGNNKVSFSNTQLEGDILGTAGSNNDLSIAGSTSILGNITFGDGNDKLTIDSESGNLLVQNTVIDGGFGIDTLILGEQDKLTIIKSNIKNFENNEFYGDIFLSSNAKLLLDSSVKNEFTSTTNNGDLLIADGGRLILGIASDSSHSLDSISGNSINGLGDGKLIIQSDNLTMGNDGKYKLDLIGTSINVADENILTSQFIYDISNIGSNILEVSIKNLGSIGINNKYQSIFDSITSSGNLGNLISTNLGNEKEFESLLSQISYKNPYSYSFKSSKESMDSWISQIENNELQRIVGQWTVTGGISLGANDFSGKYSHNSNFSGLMAIGEYGLNKSASLGIAFGGGKGNLDLDNNSSNIEKDSFYLGAYAKKDMGKFRLLGSIGLQKDRYDGNRVLENKVDYFSFDKSYDTNGLNLFVQGKHSNNLDNGLSIEPKVSIIYNYLSQNKINEENSSMSMTMDKKEVNLYEGEIGVDISKIINIKESGKDSLFVGVSYSYLGGDTDNKFKGQIGNGSKFDFKGPNFGGSFGKISLGNIIENSIGYSYGLKVEYKIGKNTKNLEGTLQLKYSF